MGHLENLITSFDRFTRDESARNESALFDAAMDCGMSYDEADVSIWAAQAITDAMVSA